MATGRRAQHIRRFVSARFATSLHRRTRLIAIAASLAPLVATGLGTSVARAASPVWEVGAQTIPTDLAPGGSGQLQLNIANVSEVGSSGIITVTDTLPPGVTAAGAGDVLNYFEASVGTGFWQCVGSTIVTCTSDPAVTPSITRGDSHGIHPDQFIAESGAVGEAPILGINVTVSPSASGTAMNSVQVSGGGAASTTTHDTPLTVSSTPTPGGVQNYTFALLNKDGTPAVQAGSHPYEMITRFTINHYLPSFPEANPVADPKDVEVDLPTGLIGNAQVVHECPRAEFDAGINGNTGEPRCLADTQVGTEQFSLSYPNFTLTMPVYNLTHPKNVPAEFGFGIFKHHGIIDAGVRTGEGYGLRANLGDIETAGFLSSTLTIWGEPADPSHNQYRCQNSDALCGFGTTLPRLPFLTLPTSCGTPLTQTLKLDFWQLPGVSQSYAANATDDHGNPLVTSGCERLRFEPSVTLRPDVTAADSPSGLQVDVHMPQTESGGLVESTLNDASVTFPAGLTVNPAAADGLVGCTPEQIGLNNGSVPSCPDASKIGLVKIDTPLLAAPLEGSLFLAQQDNNPFDSLLAVYLVAEAAGGIIVKAAGHVTLNPVTGQVLTLFDENPPLPFSDLHLELFNDQRAAFATPMTCGSYSTESNFLGYSGALASFSEPFQITSKCGGGFAPSFAAGMTDTRQAGAFSRFSLRFARSDEDQLLGGIQVHTPPGLLGDLASVPLCGEPQASQGTCGPESLIGHTTVGVGAGEKPYYIHAGQVFLTGPYKGAPFGLSIAVPAVAGPFNLGTVVVRASINVDPHTAQLTVTSDPLPQIVQGIPILLRSVEVNIDRPNFTLNPTSCNPLSIGATISSPLGASASVSTPFQASGCAGLAFKPAFAASTSGRTSKAGGASLDVKLTYPPGSVGTQAAIAKVKVYLPKQLPSRLSTLQQACLKAVFDANPARCPAGSLVGAARASTPILPVPLTGPAYFVSNGGAKFPELIVVLQGYGVRVDLAGETFISKAGITSSTFATVPDVPVSSFELYLPEGPHSALAANANLCKSRLRMPTTFTAQNGAQLEQATAIKVTGCPKVKARKKAKARKSSRARRASSGNGRSS